MVGLTAFVVPTVLSQFPSTKSNRLLIGELVLLSKTPGTTVNTDLVVSGVDELSPAVRADDFPLVCFDPSRQVIAWQAHDVS